MFGNTLIFNLKCHNDACNIIFVPDGLCVVTVVPDSDSESRWKQHLEFLQFLVYKLLHLILYMGAGIASLCELTFICLSMGYATLLVINENSFYNIY